MTPAAVVVLDNEAVQGLMRPSHPKHRRLLSIVGEVAQRNRRRRPRTAIVVPTTVRVEAGWDRADAQAAIINRITRAVDHPLTSTHANRASQLRQEVSVSSVDATVGQVMQSAPKPVVVLTSDVQDMQRLAHAVGGDVRVVHI